MKEVKLLAIMLQALGQTQIKKGLYFLKVLLHDLKDLLQ